MAFANLARGFASKVTLRTKDDEVNGKSEVGVLTLGPARGSEVVLEVEGADEKAAFVALQAKLSEVAAKSVDYAARLDQLRRRLLQEPEPEYLTDQDFEELLRPALAAWRAAVDLGTSNSRESLSFRGAGDSGHDELRVALAQLKARQRRVLKLRLVKRLTFAQIAEELRVADDREAERQYHQALDKLRQLLGRQGPRPAK